MRLLGVYILGFFVLLQSIIPVSNSELSKLGELVSHYREHLQKEDISMLEFLDLHYGLGKKAEDHDKQEPHNGSFPFHGTQIQHQLVLDCPHNLLFPTKGLILAIAEFVVPRSTGSVRGFSEVLYQPPQA